MYFMKTDPHNVFRSSNHKLEVTRLALARAIIEREGCQISGQIRYPAWLR